MKFKLLLVSSLIAIGAMALMAASINEKEKQRVELNKAPSAAGIEGKAKSEEWAKYYPRQFDSWKKTKEYDTFTDMLAKDPALAVVWGGYAFSKDYNSPRGHYYALQDNINSLRTGAPVDAKTGPLPTACWTCKSPDVPRLIEEDGELEYFTGKWAKYGSQVVNSIGCANCHDDKTAQLRASVPQLNHGLQVAGMKTFEESTHQEKRSLVCAQCHVEYYFKATPWKDAKGVDKTAAVVTYPWHNGIGKDGNAGVEGMITYYDDVNFTDWVHNISKTPMLKAQHPDFEFFKAGIHGQKGVSCADCHMPYTQEGSVKYSDHQVLENPLNAMDRTCMNCHRESEAKLKGIVHQKYERKEFLNKIAFDNLAKAHLETGKAIELGASDAELKEIRTLLRHGQFKGDMAIAAHGNYFHAPEETLRLLAAASEDAQKARIKLVKVLAKYGAIDYIAPDFDTKEKAQKLAKVDMAALSAEKMKFKQTLEQEWKKEAKAKGRANPELYKDVDTINDGKSSWNKK